MCSNCEEIITIYVCSTTQVACFARAEIFMYMLCFFFLSCLQHDSGLPFLVLFSIKFGTGYNVLLRMNYTTYGDFSSSSIIRSTFEIRSDNVPLFSPLASHYNSKVTHLCCYEMHRDANQYE